MSDIGGVQVRLCRYMASFIAFPPNLRQSAFAVGDTGVEIAETVKISARQVIQIVKVKMRYIQLVVELMSQFKID